MLGKTMRIATLCTLALAICGERLIAEKKEEEKTSHPLRRWLAKSLLLDASRHAATGFVRPNHSATRFGRPAGVRTLEPLKVLGLDTNNGVWEDWPFNGENPLKGGGRKYVEECLLGVMVEEGEKLLDKIYDETSVVDNESGDEWKALEDHVREFKQRWLEEARGSYHITYAKLRTTPEIHTLPTLKDAMDDYFSDLLLAQRAVKSSQIWYVLDALEHGVVPYVDGIDWERYIIIRTGAPFWGSTLQKRLQRMQGKDLQKLWLSTVSESAKRDERRDAEKLWLRTTSESAKPAAEKQKRDAGKWGEFE